MKTLLWSALFFLLAFTACNKISDEGNRMQNEIINSELVNYAASDAQIDVLFDDVMTELDNVLFDVMGGFDSPVFSKGQGKGKGKGKGDGKGKGKGDGNCDGKGKRDYGNSYCSSKEIIKDSDNKVKTIIITYDPNCETKKGTIRSGRIVIDIISGDFGLKDFTRVMTFEDFTINGSLINGQDSVVCNRNVITDNEGAFVSMKKDNSHYYDVMIIGENGSEIAKKGFRNLLQIEGMDSFTREDDMFHSTGNCKASGKVLKDGVLSDYSAKMKISVPLLKIFKYPFFVKGIKEVTINGKLFVMNYGDGTKDSIVTITSDGVTEVKDLADLKCDGKWRK